MSLTPRQLAASLHFRDRENCHDDTRHYHAVAVAVNGDKDQRKAYLKILGGGEADHEDKVRLPRRPSKKGPRVPSRNDGDRGNRSDPKGGSASAD